MECDLDTWVCTDADSNEGELFLNDQENGFAVWFPGYPEVDLCKNKTVSVHYTNAGALLDNFDYDFSRFEGLVLPFRGQCIDANGVHQLAEDDAVLDLLKLQRDGLTFAVAEDPNSVIACGSNDYHVTELFFMCHANFVKPDTDGTCPDGLFKDGEDCHFCDSSCGKCEENAS